MNSIDAFASVPLTALDAAEGLVVPLDASISDPEALKTLRYLMQPPSNTPAAPAKVPLHETSADPLRSENSESEAPTPLFEESIPAEQEPEKPMVFAKSPSFESPPWGNLTASPKPVLNALSQGRSSTVTVHGDAKEDEIAASLESPSADPVIMEALRAFFAPAATPSPAGQPSVSPDNQEHFVSTRITDLVSALTTGNEEAVPVSLRPFVMPLREALESAQQESGLPRQTEPLQQIQALLVPLPQNGNISIPQAQKELPPLEALRRAIHEAFPAKAKPVTSPVFEAVTASLPRVTELAQTTNSVSATVEVIVPHPTPQEPVTHASKPLTNFSPTAPVISIPSTPVPLPTPEEVLRQTFQKEIVVTPEPPLNTPSTITTNPRPVLATHSQAPDELSLPTQPVVQHQNQILQAVVKTKTDAEAPAFSAPKPLAANSSTDNTDTEPLPIAEQPAREVPNLGQAILQSIGSQSQASPAHTASHVNASVNVERLEQVSTLMTEMADRVLVTDPLHQQTPEVRIKLADHVMPGTEVRVWREEGGQLRVEFDTTSGYWARVLTEASPLLSQRLNERLNLPEAVQVNVHQQGGQPEDGRSRNRHTPWDLARQADDQ